MKTDNWSLHSEKKKTESNPYLLKQNFRELQSYYSDHEHIYTDGSKNEEKVGCAAAKYDDCKKMCILDGSSVFTAKAKAIDLALDIVNNCTYTDKFVIFSDILSVLQALNHTSSRNSQIQQLLLKHHEIASSKTIIYSWIPSHNGIYGNEKADKNAIESLT